MKNGLMLLAMLVASVTSAAYADDAAIKKALDNLGVSQTDIQPSPVAGLKTVLTANGTLYVTEDGKHVLQGPLYDVSGKEPVNVTNQLLMTRVEGLQNQMIVYRAAKEKHVITVFTDITCGYCSKLHQQMKDYNSRGITVRYLAFPRQGASSQAEKDMQSVWCAADKNKAFDAVIKQEPISPATCKTDISQHYALGVQLGIQGTPAIILENGMIIPGYKEPEELAAILDAHTALTAKK